MRITKDSIEAMRTKGFTYQEVGDVFGVTRQRVHQVYKDYRTSFRKIDKEWFKELKKGPCEKCGSLFRKNIHHIDGDRYNNTIANIIVLCHWCHVKAHTKKSRIIEQNSHEFFSV